MAQVSPQQRGAPGQSGGLAPRYGDLALGFNSGAADERGNVQPVGITAPPPAPPAPPQAAASTAQTAPVSPTSSAPIPTPDNTGGGFARAPVSGLATAGTGTPAPTPAPASTPGPTRYTITDYANAQMNKLDGGNRPTALYAPGRGGGTGGYLVKNGGGYAPTPDTALPNDQSTALRNFTQSGGGVSTNRVRIMDVVTPVATLLTAGIYGPFAAAAGAVGSGAGQAVGSNLGGQTGQQVGGLVGTVAGTAGANSLAAAAPVAGAAAGGTLGEAGTSLAGDAAATPASGFSAAAPSGASGIAGGGASAAGGAHFAKGGRVPNYAAGSRGPIPGGPLTGGNQSTNADQITAHLSPDEEVVPANVNEYLDQHFGRGFMDHFIDMASMAAGTERGTNQNGQPPQGPGAGASAYATGGRVSTQDQVAAADPNQPTEQFNQGARSSRNFDESEAPGFATGSVDANGNIMPFNTVPAGPPPAPGAPITPLGTAGSPATASSPSTLQQAAIGIGVPLAAKGIEAGATAGINKLMGSGGNVGATSAVPKDSGTVPAGASAPITPVGQEALPDLSSAGSLAANAFGGASGGLSSGAGALASSAMPAGMFDPVSGAVGGDLGAGAAGFFFAKGGRVPPPSPKGPPMAKVPPHVLMANGGEDPDAPPGGEPDGDEGASPMGPQGGAPPMPPAPPGGAAPPAAMPGAAPGAAPGQPDMAAMIKAVEDEIQQNLTPEELQEVSGMLTPRLTQLLTKADPALQAIVQAFADAAGQDTPDEGDAADGSGGESPSDADAMSSGGSQGQYAPAYGSPNAGPGGFPRKPVGGLGSIGS